MVRLTKDQYEKLKEEIIELAKQYYRERGEMPPVEELVKRFGVSFTFAYNAIRMAGWELSHPAFESDSDASSSGGGER